MIKLSTSAEVWKRMTKNMDVVRVCCSDGVRVSELKMLLRSSSVFSTIFDGDTITEEIPFDFGSDLFTKYLEFLKHARAPGKLKYEKFEKAISMAIKWGMDDFCDTVISDNSHCTGDLETAVSYEVAKMIRKFLKTRKSENLAKWEKSLIRLHTISIRKNEYQKKIENMKTEIMEELELNIQKISREISAKIKEREKQWAFLENQKVGEMNANIKRLREKCGQKIVELNKQHSSERQRIRKYALRRKLNKRRKNLEEKHKREMISEIKRLKNSQQEEKKASLEVLEEEIRKVNEELKVDIEVMRKDFANKIVLKETKLKQRLTNELASI